MNLGRPGVALLDKIKSPGKTSTDFLLPSRETRSLVLLIYLLKSLVASAIFTQGKLLS